MSKFLLVPLSLVLLLGVACTTPSSTTTTNTSTPTTADKVSAVTDLTPASLSATYPSGATTYPANASDFQSLFNTISGDPEWAAIENDVGTASGAASTALQNALSSFESDLGNFTTSKSASLSSTVPAGPIGKYSQINAPGASITASLSATTFDGQAIASDGSNVKSVSGSFLDTLDVSLIPASLAGYETPLPLINGELRFNFGFDASATVDQSGAFTNNTGNLTIAVDYSLSASLAMTVNSSRNGGNVIVNVTSKFSTSSTYPLATTDLSTALGSFLPSTTPTQVTVTVYDDLGVQRHQLSYSTYSDFSNAFSGAASLLKAPTGTVKLSPVAALTGAKTALTTALTRIRRQ